MKWIKIEYNNKIMKIFNSLFMINRIIKISK